MNTFKVNALKSQAPKAPLGNRSSTISVIAVDLAKNVFELAQADAQGHIVQRLRLSRAAFAAHLHAQPPCRWVLEACGSAHHWARQLIAQAHQVTLLPPQYVRAYRLRNKTDRADCAALLEAVKNTQIHPVPIKTQYQQTLQGLHRMRSQWMGTRTARINELRGLLGEMGLIMPQGAAKALAQVPALLAQGVSDGSLPPVLAEGLQLLVAEIRGPETRVVDVERKLSALTRELPDVARLQQISGIGLLTATALYSRAGSAGYFRSGRHFASWLGLTPREHSSGQKRQLGGISKRGDGYVRMLLMHGARAVLQQALKLHQAMPQRLSYLQRWVVGIEQRRGYNKATAALANKLARIAWASWRHDRVFDGNYALGNVV